MRSTVVLTYVRPSLGRGGNFPSRNKMLPDNFREARNQVKFGRRKEVFLLSLQPEVRNLEDEVWWWLEIPAGVMEMLLSALATPSPLCDTFCG